jgi:serine/threonine protein kinase
MANSWEGKVLGGRYEIGELLGQGGMSSVYKANDPNLRRSVAIKMVHPHLSNNPEFVRRFEEEATAVARLRHPNIIQVYDFSHEDDLYYMVMEYLAGETLQARLKRLNAAGRRLPLRDVLKYAADICKAAGYAHQRGMIHRDIKPANVMLDVHGNAILMDFGIARIIGGQQHTATGAVLGTALYMAPEQIQGLHPDARADIYSIGVLLYEALSGHPPFEADSAMTLMMMHLNDPVPDLSQFHPGIPEEVRQIANQALEKDRARRYQTSEEMAAALQTALEVEAASPSEPVRPSPKPVDRSPASRPPAADAIPSAPLQATVIEQAPEFDPQATHLEAASVPDPQATFVEPAPAAPSPTANDQAGAPASPAPLPRESAYPVGPTPTGSLGAPARRAGGSKLMGVVIGVLLLAMIGGGAFLFSQRSPGGQAPENTPAALVPAISPTENQALPVAVPTGIQSSPVTVPEETEAPLPEPTSVPTETALPSPTPTESPTQPPPSPVMAGADRIAFISGSDIWTANLDGSQLVQLTQDGAVKKYLRWLPDGSGVSYISGKCIQTASLEGLVDTVTCFNSSEHLDSFEVSPDGLRVALSLDRQLYLLPFDLVGLSQADTHGKLKAMADCTELAPYQRNAAYYAVWSKDSSRLAVVIMGVLQDGRRGDLVQVIPVDRCIANPLIAIHFPDPHFAYPEYQRTPTLQNLAWNGLALFAFHGLSRNEGFGNLHIFNMETYKASLSVNPIDGKCCYRDPQWSPDGTYLLFAFQDMGQGEASTTRFYYIPYGSIGTGATYEPLPLPEITDPREQPQAVLRPATTGE